MLLVGFELYCRLLRESVSELKGEIFSAYYYSSSGLLTSGDSEEEEDLRKEYFSTRLLFR